MVWIHLTQNRDRYDVFVNFWLPEYCSNVLLPVYETTRCHIQVAAERTSNLIIKWLPRTHCIVFTPHNTLHICPYWKAAYLCLQYSWLVLCRTISFCFTAGMNLWRVLWGSSTPSRFKIKASESHVSWIDEINVRL